jgi:hypothetical protein
VYPVAVKRSMMGTFARDACEQTLRAIGQGHGQAGMRPGHLWTCRGAQDPRSSNLSLRARMGLGLEDCAAMQVSLRGVLLPPGTIGATHPDGERRLTPPPPRGLEAADPSLWLERLPSGRWIPG